MICEILVLNRSSYYEWRNRIVPEKENKDQELCELIIEYDCSYNHISGYRRMTMYINRLNNTNQINKVWYKVCLELVNVW